MPRLKKPTNPPLVINEIAKPEFKGDKQRLIQVVQGVTEPYDPDIIPPCFGDPNLESGVCNPLRTLAEGEPGECVFAKSCLVAKMLASNIPVDVFKCRDKSYEQVLSEADELFEKKQKVVEPDPGSEQEDRQHLRAHIASVALRPPINPFRKNSLRRLVLDILGNGWVTLGDLKATVLAIRPDATRLDIVIGQVTSLTTQEANAYRILESFGKYKAFRKA